MLVRSKADAYRLAELVGGLSRPSKMPCHSYSLPASACRVGSRLAKVPGTDCASCYALKGRYRFPAVQAALQRRLDALARPDWADVLARVIGFLESREHGGSGYFRWHDSGDLQGLDHFRRICDVALLTGHVRHWLPTREVATVSRYLRGGGVIPANLTVRVSSGVIDGSPSLGLGLPVAVVTRGESTCPAPRQGNVCGDCRACWSPQVPLVSYKHH